MSDTASVNSGADEVESDSMTSKLADIFKQMDVRGDGDVSWEDFSAVRP